jgi:hypothetical protein
MKAFLDFYGRDGEKLSFESWRIAAVAPCTRVARFFLVQLTKRTYWPQNIYVYQMDTKYNKWQ